MPDVEPEALAGALAALDRSELVVYPTDTLYGLGADALDVDAVVRVFEAKQRPRDQPLSVAVADLAMLQRVARIPAAHRGLVERLLPGPVTLILRPDPGMPDELRGGAPGLGVRIPAHPIARELCARFGPVTATSANLHGQASPATIAEARRQLGASVQAYLDAGPLQGKPSTVIDLTGPAPRVVREGALPSSELQPWRATSTSRN